MMTHLVATTMPLDAKQVDTTLSLMDANLLTWQLMLMVVLHITFLCMYVY